MLRVAYQGAPGAYSEDAVVRLWPDATPIPMRECIDVARAVESGVLSINSNTSVRVSTPFGGFKQSGYGRELGPHATDAYTEVKTVYYATEGR